jgi:outer membrane lipoprotein-sorting protein
MLKSSLNLLILILWLGLNPLLTLAADAIQIQELVKQTEKVYRELDDLKMNFKREIKSEVFKQPNIVKGTIYLKQPDKFRLDSDEETIVSDGAIVWTHNKEARQALKQNLSAPEKFNFLSFLSDMQSRYNSTYGGKEAVGGLDCHKIELTPKEKGRDFKKLILWVDGKTYLIGKMETKDLLENETIFWFTQIKINPKLKPGLFEFRLPPKVELIDLTQPESQ